MKHHATAETASTPSPVRPSRNSSVDSATLELLATWRHQDATDDPEAIRAAEQELKEFKMAMDENRALAGEPRLHP